MKGKQLVLATLFTGFLATGSAQENRLYMDVGYAFDKYQLTPHVWLGYSGGKDFRFGGFIFHNLDRITREWPGEGIYYQTKRQYGIGLLLEGQTPFNKHAIFYEIRFGMNYRRWVVKSDNEFLRHAILPREDPQREAFYLFHVGYRYQFTEQWAAGISGGLGENQIKLQVSRVL